MPGGSTLLRSGWGPFLKREGNGGATSWHPSPSRFRGHCLVHYKYLGLHIIPRVRKEGDSVQSLIRSPSTSETLKYPSQATQPLACFVSQEVARMGILKSFSYRLFTEASRTIPRKQGQSEADIELEGERPAWRKKARMSGEGRGQSRELLPVNGTVSKWQMCDPNPGLSNPKVMHIIADEGRETLENHDCFKRSSRYNRRFWKIHSISNQRAKRTF
jgi:hypothetical protein